MKIGFIVSMLLLLLLLILRVLMIKQANYMIKELNNDINDLMPFTEYVILIHPFILKELKRRYVIQDTYRGLKLVEVEMELPFMVVDVEELERIYYENVFKG